MGHEKRSWLTEELERRGVSRREFLGFCGTMAASLALPEWAAGDMAEALEHGKKPVLVWLNFQDCAGNSESFLRSGKPAVADLVLDILSVEYQEVIMAAAGHQAEEHRNQVIRDYAGEYLVVVEGSIPTAENGVHCTIGGRTAADIAHEVCSGAAATIAIGTCAAYGGIPAAAPNPTAALGVADAMPDLDPVINLPACPANAANLTALVVYYLTYERWPPLDRYQRPLFAYGKSIHDACERRAHYDAGQYVEQWGDEGHREGYCLYKVGCKGPVTFQNCPNVGWNDGTNWPIGCGHPCIGCAEPDFWDKMTPFYSHLGDFPGFGVHSDIDKLGLWLTGATAAAFGAHGLVQIGKSLAQKDTAEATADGGSEGGTA